MSRWVVCETIAAITTHLRQLADGEEPNYGGHVTRPLTLCGKEAAWDTRSPLASMRCIDCMKIICTPGPVIFAENPAALEHFTQIVEARLRKERGD